MHRMVIPFTTQDLIIVCLDHMGKQRWENIELEVHRRLNNIIGNLDQIESTSKLSILNNSDPGYPVDLSQELFDLININDHYYKVTSGKFKLFEPDQVVVNEPVMLIYRKGDRTISISKLYTEYVMDSVAKLLRKHRCKDFLISGSRSYLSSGDKEWEIIFPHPSTGEEIEMIVGSQATVINYPRSIRQKSRELTPFGGDDPNAPTIEGVIVESDNIVIAKVTSELAFEHTAEFQLKQFAVDWKCGLTVFYSDGVIKQYR